MPFFSSCIAIKRFGPQSSTLRLSYLSGAAFHLTLHAAPSLQSTKRPQIKKLIVVTHNKFEVQRTGQGVYLNIQLITYGFDSLYDTHCYTAA